MIHNFNKVCNLLVLGRLNEPFAEVALYRDMEHFLLLASQSSRLYLLLHLDELCMAQFHHLRELLRAQEQCSLPELLRQGHLHEFKSWDQAKGLSWHSHKQRLTEIAESLFKEPCVVLKVDSGLTQRIVQLRVARIVRRQLE